MEDVNLGSYSLCSLNLYKIFPFFKQNNAEFPNSMGTKILEKAHAVKYLFNDNLLNMAAVEMQGLSTTGQKVMKNKSI